MTDTAEDSFQKFEYLDSCTPFVERIQEIIQHIDLLEDFEHGDVERLARYMRCYRAPAGMEIIQEGDPGDFMLLLIDGEVEIVKKDVRGLPVRIALAGPGRTLGEMSLIDGEPRFASCVTLADSTFAVLDRDHLIRLIAEDSQVGVKLLMELLVMLNQRLREASGQLMRCREDRRLRLR